MKSRKLLLPLATLGLLMGLVACGGNKEESTSKSEQQSQQQSSSEQSQSSEQSSETVSSSDQSSEPEVEKKIEIVSPDNVKKIVGVGKTLQLSAKYEEQVLEGVTWSSNKETVATVDQNGLVTAVGAGSVKISAAKEGYVEKSFSITVELEKITITAPENAKELVMEQTLQLTADQQGVEWASSDDTIATVNAGLVTAVKPGAVEITASKANFTKGSYQITVVRPAALATLHFEDADHTAADGWWGTAAEGYSPVYARSEGNASDLQCIAHLDEGDKEVLTFTSSAAIKAELVIMMASSSEIADMSAVMDVKLNNAAVTVPAVAFTTGSNSQFNEFSLGELDLVQGDNALELDFKASAPYIDDLAIYSKGTATIVVKAAPEKEQIEVQLEEEATNMTAYLGLETQIQLKKPTSLEGVSFATDKETVATVDENGKVTGVALGTANITISKAGMLSARLEVVVEKKVLQGEIRVEAENTENELPGGFHKYTDKTSGITNGHSNSAYITGYDVSSACSLEYKFNSEKDQTMSLIIAGAPHYKMSDPFNFATDCEILLNGVALTVNADAQIEPGSTMGAATVEVTIGNVNVIAGENTFVINFPEKAPALDCYRFMPLA